MKICTAAILTFAALSVGATSPTFAEGGKTICPTLPGSNFRDYSKPCTRVDGDQGYQTYPGTNVRDYSKPGFEVSEDSVCPTLPGSNVRDYSKPCARVEGDRAYQTLPGTKVRDYSKPGVKVFGDLVCPTIAGTDVRDYGEPCTKVDAGSVYPTYPGTSVRDYSRPGKKVDGDEIYPTLPGTDIRDYSKPGARVDSYGTQQRGQAPLYVAPATPPSGPDCASVPGYCVDGDYAYPTMPGTTWKDYTKPGMVFVNGQLCTTFAGSRIPDRSQPCVRVEK